MPTSFLFINKDAQSQSLTRGTAGEQANINSYVQRGRRHRRVKPASSKSEQLPAERIAEVEQNDSPSSGTGSSSSADTTLTDYGGDRAVPEKDTAVNFLTPSASGSAQSPYRGSAHTPFLSPISRAHEIDATIREEVENSLIRASETRHASSIDDQCPPQFGPSRIPPTALTTIDPFNNACIPIDSQVHNLLHYYLSVYHPSVWHTGSAASPQGQYIYKPAAGEVIRNALDSEVDMFAMLACMSARMEVVDQLATGHDTSTYMQKALVATRRRISDMRPEQAKHSEQILMIIFHLFAAEGYRDNDFGARIHLQGAKTIVDGMGGLANMRDAQMRELLVIGDGYLAAKILEPCVFPCEFDPGSLSENIKDGWKRPERMELDSIAIGVKRLAHAAFIPIELIKLFDEVVECAWVLTHADMSSEAGPVMMRWLQMRNMAVRYRLLGLQLDDAHHQALRASLIIWILTTMTLLGRRRIVSSMAPLFKDLCSEMPESRADSNPYKELELWMLMLGAMGASQDGAVEMWFVRKLHQQIQRYSAAIDRAEALRVAPDVLTLQMFHEMFFYHAPAQHQRLERLSLMLEAVSATRDESTQWSTALHIS